jgi:DNA-binding NtrC family response regulator
MRKVSILIVDDDRWYLKTVSKFIEKIDNVEIKTLSDFTINDIIDFANFDLIILDYLFPEFTGTEILEKLEEKKVSCEIIFLSSQTDLKIAVNLMRAENVLDYIVKDQAALPHLIFSISNHIKTKKLKLKLEVLQKNQNQSKNINSFLKGSSTQIEKVKDQIKRVADLKTNILIQGETGVGKDVVARAIHFASNKSDYPFIAVNCSAIPEQLLESELFGFEKGTFTGAEKAKPGKFELAGKGTIFLDEIGDMPLKLQVKLLRIIEEGEVFRLGALKPLKLNCRIISATNLDLQLSISQEKFRSDLYYRLKGFPIKVPPLRERLDDLPILCEYFLKKFAKENNMPIKTLNAKNYNKLLKYNYPGNVRELKSILDLACILSDTNELSIDSIQFDVNPFNHESVNLTLREHTEKIIMEYLEKYNNNVRLVSDKLDVGKSTIYRLIQSREK